MAGNGPPPKEQRRRRNADTYEGLQSTVSADDPPSEVPEMPEGDWLPETVEWWEDWCASPQAKLFLATDWRRLRMLVPLVDKYHSEPEGKTLAEIRLNESLLGATHTDRLKARIKVERGDGKPQPGQTPAGVAALDEYRKAVGK